MEQKENNQAVSRFRYIHFGLSISGLPRESDASRYMRDHAVKEGPRVSCPEAAEGLWHLSFADACNTRASIDAMHVLASLKVPSSLSLC